jgi:hypothetical protein
MRRGYASNLVYARMKRGLTSRGRVCRVGGGGGWRESRGLKLARRLRAEIGLAKVNRGRKTRAETGQNVSSQRGQTRIPSKTLQSCKDIAVTTS